jgi:hypothetical protein
MKMKIKLVVQTPALRAFLILILPLHPAQGGNFEV